VYLILRSLELLKFKSRTEIQKGVRSDKKKQKRKEFAYLFWRSKSRATVASVL